MELAIELEEQGYTDEDAQQKVAQLRQQLLMTEVFFRIIVLDVYCSVHCAAIRQRS